MFLLSHYNFDIVFFLSVYERNYAAVNFVAVNDELFNSLFNIRRIGYFDVVCSATEFSCDLEITEAVRYAGINGKSLVSGIYAEDVL